MKRRESEGRTQLFKENKGSAIVMVLVVIAFVSILVSVLFYRSILNYQMKVVDYNAKDNFYTAENALDEIRTGLQSIASDAIAEAYVEVMQKYDEFSNDTRKQEFVDLYFQKMVAELKDNSAVSTEGKEYYDKAVLEKFVTDLMPEGGTKGAQLNLDVANNELVLYEEAVVLKNLKVTYTDDGGFVSIISTDIRIAVPKIDFNQAFQYPELMDCSIIANDSIEATQGYITVQGNVYAGSEGVKVGLSGTNAQLNVDNNQFFVSDGMISVGSASAFNYATTPGTTSDLWAKGIEVESGTVNINSNIHVADDTTIKGKKSEVTYAGVYYGFGEEKGTGVIGSEGSSAILINGLESEVDFSSLSALTLAGNAYINIKGKGSIGHTTDPNDPTFEDKKIVVEGVENEDITTQDNILMGESIAVKSDQLAYLVPAECIGYYPIWKADGTLDRIEKIGRNPITETELNSKIKEPRSTVDDIKKQYYKEVDLEMVSSLGTSLDDMGVSFRKLYKQESGEVLVYYYMVFSDAAKANSFFREYYENNKSKMDDYISRYVSKLDLGDLSNKKLDIAGNILRAETVNDSVSYVLENDTLGASTANPDYLNTLKFFKEEYESFHDKYLFENIIDMRVFTYDANRSDLFIPADMYEGVDVKVARFTSTDGNYEAAIVKCQTDAPYILSGDVTKLRIVVVKGDVVVQSNYKGIIIASGKVTLGNGINIMKDEEGVTKAMQISRMDSNDVVHRVIDVFVDGNALEVAPDEEGTGNDEEHVKVEELVGYANWNKQ